MNNYWMIDPPPLRSVGGFLYICNDKSIYTILFLGNFLADEKQ